MGSSPSIETTTDDSFETDSTCSNLSVPLQNESKQVLYKPNYAMFPTHKTLRRENEIWIKSAGEHQLEDRDNSSLPLVAVTSKEQLLEDIPKEDLNVLDEFALQTPRAFLQESLSGLVGYLFMKCNKNSNKNSNDIAKLRVLYQWVAAHNPDNLPGGLHQGSIGKCLQDIWKGKVTHAQLFQDMCKIAKIECKIIKGVVKSLKDKVGSSRNLQHEIVQSEWNVVLVNSEWRFIDSEFGSKLNREWDLIDENGQIVTAKQENGSIKSPMNDFYFLTDPEEFIYTHLPNEEEWQLLVRPVLRHEFDKMPYLTSSFFSLDFSVSWSARHGILDAPHGETEITLFIKTGENRRLFYQLTKKTDDLNDEAVDTKKLINSDFLRNCVYVEQIDDRVIIKVSLPLAGNYRLTLHSHNSGLDNNDNSVKSFSCIAEFSIICKEGKDTWKELPNNKRMEWGPGQDVNNAGLVPISHNLGIIESENGRVIIQFKMIRPLKLVSKLRGNDEKQTDFSRWTLHREENGQAVIYTKLLKEGIYALDIFVISNGDKDRGRHLICTYLIKAVVAAFDRIPLPKVEHQRTGETRHASQYGLEPVSHCNSLFTNETSEVNIEMKHSPSVKFTTKLFLKVMSDTNSSYEISNHVFIRQKSKHSIFSMRFPHIGVYLFRIFAKQKDQDLDYICVYNYVISVKKAMLECRPFPKVFSPWGEGCEIHALKDGVLPSEQEVAISVTVPNAKEVGVINRYNEWLMLKKVEKNEHGVWVGNMITSSEPDSILKLSASFSESQDEFSTLLEYQIKSKKYFESLTKEQEEHIKVTQKRKKKEKDREHERNGVCNRLKKELKGSMSGKQIEQLKKILTDIESYYLITRLKEGYGEAKVLVASFEKIEDLSQVIIDNNITETISCVKPTQLVHNVMIASFLLLGEKEQVTKSWKNCQSILRHVKMKRRLAEFNFRKVHLEIAAKVFQILSDRDYVGIDITSNVVNYFYKWAYAVLEEINMWRNGQLDTIKPADLARQKVLLKK